MLAIIESTDNFELIAEMKVVRTFKLAEFTVTKVQIRKQLFIKFRFQKFHFTNWQIIHFSNIPFNFSIQRRLYIAFSLPRFTIIFYPNPL